MRYSKYQTGPFPIRLWLEDHEIEAMAFEQVKVKTRKEERTEIEVFKS